MLSYGWEPLTLTLGPLNLFIGANASGKSNLVNPALLKLGLISYNQGNTSAAINYYKQVFANNPENEEAKDALAALEEIYVKDLGKPGEYFAFLETIPGYKVDNLKRDYQTGTPQGEARFMEIVDEIKREGRGKKYDCVVGVSGGTDSSYMLLKAIEWGLRPLAVHYDNTWNTAISMTTPVAHIMPMADLL